VQTGQPSSGGPRRGSRQTHTDEELLVGYVDPSLPCPPAKRATDGDLLDLPLATSGARPTGRAVGEDPVEPKLGVGTGKIDFLYLFSTLNSSCSGWRAR